MPFRSEKQRRYLWKNNPEIARKWTNEHGSTPVKAKKGKYQKLEHPDHEIKPIEHKEENVSSKERVEKLLDERKTKKETKKKLVKQGPAYVPGWRPNLSVKAKESKYITKETALKGHADSIKEIYKVAKENKGEDRLTQWDIDNARKVIKSRKLYKSPYKVAKPYKYDDKKAVDYLRKQKKESKETNIRTRHPVLPPEHFRRKIKTGGPIKARKGIDIQKKSALNRIKYSSKWDKSLKNRSEIWKRAKETARDRLTLWDIRNAQKTIQGEKKQLESVVDVRSKGGPIKAKKGIGLPPATKYKKYLKGLKKATTTPLSGTSTGLPPKTARLLSQLKFAYKDRNKKFNWKAANETLPFAKSVKKITRKLALNRMKKNIAKSPFLQRRFKLAGLSSNIPISKKTKYFKDMIKTVGTFPDAASAYKSARSRAIQKGAFDPKPSGFLKRRMTLGSMRSLPTSTKALAVLKKLGRRTHIGKAVAAATVVAGAYEAGKRKLFTKDKKKVTKKSIGGETVVMKSGGGYIDDLL